MYVTETRTLGNNGVHVAVFEAVSCPQIPIVKKKEL